MNRSFKIGDRIRLIHMPDDPDPLPIGSEGTIVGIYPLSDWIQVDVNWDNGRSLMFSIPPDQVAIAATDADKTN